MAMAPAFHEDWPTTSVLPQEPPPTATASVSQQCPLAPFSYADIAIGKHSALPMEQLPSNFSNAPPIINNGLQPSSNAVLYVEPPPLVPLPPSALSPSSCSPHVNPPPLLITNGLSPVHHTSASFQHAVSSLGQDGTGSGSYAVVTDSWQTAVEDMERDNVIREKIGLVVNQRYRIVQKISFGSYGSIYSAVDLRTNREVAVKFEIGAKQNTDLHLKYENDVYHAIKGAKGVPAIYWFGSEYEHEILVMQLLGPSLEQLFNFCERTFSPETIVSLGEQMLQRIRNLHSRGFLHRDIKPENFLMGIGDEENVCFLVDFGLARRYRFRDGEGSLKHIPFRKGKNLVGTAKYASLNSHNGLELSRRDDLESLGYIIVEFINQELPWKEQRNKSRFRTKQQSYNRIRNIKEQTDWACVCPRMLDWIAYCRQLDFTDDPDYDLLAGILQSLNRPEENGAEVVDSSTNTQQQQSDDTCCSSTSPVVSPPKALQQRGPTRCSHPSPAVNGSGQSSCEYNGWTAGSMCVPPPRIPRGVQGVRWPPATATPPPRFPRPPNPTPFNTGGGFACPPPMRFRYPVDTQRTPFPSQPNGGESTGQRITAHGQHHQQAFGSFTRNLANNCNGDETVEETSKRRFDDGTKRYNWLMRRDSSPNQRYAFDCLFRWTLPQGCEPVIPLNRAGCGGAFGGLGGVRNPFQSPPHHNHRYNGRARQRLN